MFAKSILTDVTNSLIVAFFVVITLGVLAIIITVNVINHRYKKFVLEHSVSLKTLDTINTKYKFKNVPNYDMVHSYDNENFYCDISCRDYLTYQLVYIQKKVVNAIHIANENKSKYEDYKSEVIGSCTLNTFDTDELLKNTKKLKKIESKMLEEKLLFPTIEFKIVAKLILTNINDYYRHSKAVVFNSKTILDIIHDLNQKRGSFYLNNDIWNSICRVERGKVTNKLRFAIYARDGNRCRKCGRSGRHYDLEIDHIIPIAKGGKTTYDNLQTLCHRCNVKKGDSMPY